MKKLLSALVISALSIGLLPASTAVAADTTTPATKKIVKKKINKGKKTKAAPAPFAFAAPDDEDTGAPIDPKKAEATEYQCELGATLTIFRNAEDNNYIALRYQNLITRMKRVGTTTGANRFENKKSGLVWIGIPAKGILLDAKQGRQLANDCKDAEQLKPVIVSPVAPAETAKPVEAAKPSEAAKPTEMTKPVEAAKPAEPTKPAKN